jgi:hypothetical protein
MPHKYATRTARFATARPCESAPAIIEKTVEAYTRILQLFRYVRDQGIATFLKDLAARRSISKEFLERTRLFRDHGPREGVLSRQ